MAVATVNLCGQPPEHWVPSSAVDRYLAVELQFARSTSFKGAVQRALVKLDLHISGVIQDGRSAARAMLGVSVRSGAYRPLILLETLLQEKGCDGEATWLYGRVEQSALSLVRAALGLDKVTRAGRVPIAGTCTALLLPQHVLGCSVCNHVLLC